MLTCGGHILRQRFPYQLGTSSGLNLTRYKKGRVYTLIRIYWPQLLDLHPQFKTHLLGWLYTLQICTTAFSAHLVATKRLIIRRALKVTIHTGAITPWKTSCNNKRLSGGFQFFPCSFLCTSSLLACLYLSNGIPLEVLQNWDSFSKALYR